MITFFLIRHGQKEEGFGDPPLTNVGVRQAEYTAKYLKDKNIEYIYSSPLKRTIQTAKIIAKELYLEVSIDERLRERMNWGDKPNKTFDEFTQEWRKTDLDRDYQPTHGDSSRKAGQRLESFLHDVSKSILQGTILVVTCGGVIGDFLRNVFPEKDLPILKDEVSQARYIDILNCSITVVEKDHNRFLLKQVGVVSHLPAPLI